MTVPYRPLLREIQVRRSVMALQKGNVEALEILRGAFGGLCTRIYVKYRYLYSSDRELWDDITSVLWETAVAWDSSRNKSALKYLMTMFWNNVYKYIRLKCAMRGVDRKAMNVVCSFDNVDVADPNSEMNQSVLAVSGYLASHYGQEQGEAVMQLLLEDSYTVAQLARVLHISRKEAQKEQAAMHMALRRLLEE